MLFNVNQTPAFTSQDRSGDNTVDITSITAPFNCFSQANLQASQNTSAAKQPHRVTIADIAPATRPLFNIEIDFGEEAGSQIDRVSVFRG